MNRQEKKKNLPIQRPMSHVLPTLLSIGKAVVFVETLRWRYCFGIWSDPAEGKAYTRSAELKGRAQTRHVAVKEPKHGYGREAPQRLDLRAVRLKIQEKG
jgi:hypothetical protein